ncbi:hypothetical protein [Flavobacterium panacagri]|uniref:hypothetical protein n=1 Tax=Flavobacterium panacagri TaxID=3034146 RepID=UPI0025A5B7EE|nr:hypothetical protein [Flavobacterium panacagri]
MSLQKEYTKVKKSFLRYKKVNEMKQYLIIVFIAVGISTTLQAQVGNYSNNPNINSVLDLNNSSGTANKGLALPRVTLISTTDPSPLSGHVTGMMVYNTTATGSGSTQVKEGIYTNDGSQWIPILGATAIPWDLKGNNNVNSLNFIGTTDNTDFVTRTNNTERLRVTTGGKLLVNTAVVPTGGSNPKLIINNGSTNGALMIKDGTEGLAPQGEGKVFTSDANGLGSWAPPSLNLNSMFGNSSPDLGVTLPSTATATWSFTNRVITLPPGKWLLRIGFNCPVYTYSATNESWSVRATFSNSSTTMAPSSDILSSAPYISAFMAPMAHSFVMKGSMIIQNTTSTNKDYYFCAGYVTTNNPTATQVLQSIGRLGNGNYIVVQKIN